MEGNNILGSKLRSPVSSLATDDREIEANQFAAELLMPLDLISAAIKKLPKKMETENAVAELANQFDVSVQAMTIRLSSVNILK